MEFQKFFLIWVPWTILEGWEAELEMDPFMCIKSSKQEVCFILFLASMHIRELWIVFLVGLKVIFKKIAYQKLTCLKDAFVF